MTINVSFSFDTLLEAQEFLSGVSLKPTLKTEGAAAVLSIQERAANQAKAAGEFLSDKGKVQAEALGKQPPAVVSTKKPAPASTKSLSPIEKAKAEAARIKAEAEAKAKSTVTASATTKSAVQSKPGVGSKLQLLEINEVGGVAVCWPPEIAKDALTSELYAEWVEEYNASMATIAEANPMVWETICDEDYTKMKSGIITMATQVAKDNDTDMQAWLDSVKEMVGVTKFREATDEQVAKVALILLLSVKGFSKFFPAS